ncbi:MAG: hypothetical protein B193_2141, partial [Solidesulfovibrio magneticus str. Maddingley MBC34]
MPPAAGGLGPQLASEKGCLGRE